MTQARSRMTATTLLDGRIFVAGGFSNGRASGTAEIFDSATGTWTATAPMRAPRADAAAVRLSDGRVLVAGGNQFYYAGTGEPRRDADAEIYDPASDTWTLTAPMRVARAGHIAALLPDGRVLAAGGDPFYCMGEPPGTAEIYDPDADSWAETGTPSMSRLGGSAVDLADGRVLVVGGRRPICGVAPIAGTEIYTPATGTWRRAASLPIPVRLQTATALDDGRVLVVGGCCITPPVTSVVQGLPPADTSAAPAFVYETALDVWIPTGPMNVLRYAHDAVTLRDGRVLVSGGVQKTGTDYKFTWSTEIFDPATDVWTATTDMIEPRTDHRLALLPNGDVLALGGRLTEYETPTALAERFAL